MQVLRAVRRLQRGGQGGVAVLHGPALPLRRRPLPGSHRRPTKAPQLLRGDHLPGLWLAAALQAEQPARVGVQPRAREAAALGGGGGGDPGHARGGQTRFCGEGLGFGVLDSMTRGS